MKLNFNLMILSCLFTSAVILLTSCNTVQGFGKDMQAGGQQLEKAACRHCG